MQTSGFIFKIYDSEMYRKIASNVLPRFASIVSCSLLLYTCSQPPCSSACISYEFTQSRVRSSGHTHQTLAAVRILCVSQLSIYGFEIHPWARRKSFNDREKKLNSCPMLSYWLFGYDQLTGWKPIYSARFWNEEFSVWITLTIVISALNFHINKYAHLLQIHKKRPEWHS